MNDTDIDEMMRMDDLSRCSNNSLMKLSEYERTRLYRIANTVKQTDASTAEAQRNAAFAEEMRRMRKLDDETEENLAAEYAKIKHEVQLRKAIEQRKGLEEYESVNKNVNEEIYCKKLFEEKLLECCEEKRKLEQQFFSYKELSMLEKELCAIETELQKRKALCKTAIVLPIKNYLHQDNTLRTLKQSRTAQDKIEDIAFLEESKTYSNNKNAKHNHDEMHVCHLDCEPILDATHFAPYLTLHSDGEFTRYEAIQSRLPAQRSVESTIKRCMLPKDAKRSKHYPQPSPFHAHNAHSSFTALEKWQRLDSLPDVK